MIWLILAMILISAPLSYFIRKEAREAERRRSRQKAFVNFRINAEAFRRESTKIANALQAFGKAAEQTSVPMSKFAKNFKRGL